MNPQILTFVRVALMAIATFLVAQGVLSTESTDQFVAYGSELVGTLFGLVSLFLAVRERQHRETVALSLPEGSSRTELNLAVGQSLAGGNIFDTIGKIVSNPAVRVGIGAIPGKGGRVAGQVLDGMTAGTSATSISARLCRLEQAVFGG